jgi:hypothetical protein
MTAESVRTYTTEYAHTPNLVRIKVERRDSFTGEVKEVTEKRALHFVPKERIAPPLPESIMVQLFDK